MRLEMRGLRCARNEGHPYREATEESTCRGKKLFASYTLAEKGQKDAETKLDKLGWDLLRRQPWCEHLWNINPQVAAFDKKAEQRRESLKSLRRSYVIKLFADHPTTQIRNPCLRLSQGIRKA
jgi:hypothetical protein